ncbi:hypothetical protein ATANTOWER_020346 [Ataeniobius toweri]|uniref:Uncharacterized protein n=1 Tax=Ataeniobius toweri TaxID=208326 RepID=A0ABU7BJN1_9TELE|nr:hypothetical protein [Ataeniobius toweri]
MYHFSFCLPPFILHKVASLFPSTSGPHDMRAGRFPNRFRGVYTKLREGEKRKLVSDEVLADKVFLIRNKIQMVCKHTSSSLSLLLLLSPLPSLFPFSPCFLYFFSS